MTTTPDEASRAARDDMARQRWTAALTGVSLPGAVLPLSRVRRAELHLTHGDAYARVVLTCLSLAVVALAGWLAGIAGGWLT